MEQDVCTCAACLAAAEFGLPPIELRSTVPNVISLAVVRTARAVAAARTETNKATVLIAAEVHAEHHVSQYRTELMRQVDPERANRLKIWGSALPRASTDVAGSTVPGTVPSNVPSNVPRNGERNVP